MLARNSFVACSKVLLALALTSSVHAAEPEPVGDEPILDDLGRARTLTPPPGGLAGVIEDGPEEPAGPGREVALIMGHVRWVNVPGFIFDSFFDHYQSLNNASVGVAYEWGDIDKAMWAVELDWSGLSTDAGNWLEKDTPAFGASYAENGLSLLSVDATYRRQFPLSPKFRFSIGGGLGLGVLIGDIETAEVLPTCTDPVAECAHWPSATNDTAELPTRVVPIIHVLVGAEYEIGDGFMVRLQGGFRDVFYAGLSVGTAL